MQVVVLPLTVACGSPTAVPSELLMVEGVTSEQMGWSPRLGLVVVVVVVDTAVELVADVAEGPLEHDVRTMAPANPARTTATAGSLCLGADRRKLCRRRRLPPSLVPAIAAGPVRRSAGDGTDDVVDART